jgi:uncharacterized protein YndB with AHSA1/START domain
MNARQESELTRMKNPTTMERTSERELVVTRAINASPRIVFEAWTKPELFKQWWVPKSFGLSLLSFEADVRVGGQYSLVSRHGDSAPMTFFGKYIEVTPPSRLAWTNDEAGEAGPVTTVTLEQKGGKTLQIVHELYPSKKALDAAMASGEKSGTQETFEQLDELLASLAAG